MTMNDTDNLEKALAVDAPPPSPEENSPTAEDFFGALDRQVNGGILEPADEAATADNQNLSSATSQSSAQTDEGSHNWEKRYKDSSSEAQRINSRLKEIEPYTPILDAMRKDPNLITHVQNYFSGDAKAPNVKEQLGLDEDFIFDADEAVTDSNSDSAKVLRKMVDSQVESKVGRYAQAQQAELNRDKMEDDFRKRHEMGSDEWKSLVDYAQNRTLTIDDVYYLKNRENRDKNVADSARKDMTDQMKRVRQKPLSAASQGSAGTTTKSFDDQVFDSVLGNDNELEAALGI